MYVVWVKCWSCVGKVLQPLTLGPHAAAVRSLAPISMAVCGPDINTCILVNSVCPFDNNMITYAIVDVKGVEDM